MSQNGKQTEATPQFSPHNPLPNPTNGQSFERRTANVNSIPSPSGNDVPENHNGLHLAEDDAPRENQATLFERFMTHDVKEHKAYIRIIDNQNQRLQELDHVHRDLENRLELERQGRAELEASLEVKMREWALKFQELEEDRDRWKDVVQEERNKCKKMQELMLKLEQNSREMMRRKVRLTIFELIC